MADESEVLVYGIPMPSMLEGFQPLECVVLIQGIDMNNGNPTMTSLGSAGMTPWVAVGLMELEIERLKMSYVFNSTDHSEED